MSLLEIFQYDFLLRSLVAALLIGCIAPAIGSFLVARRYSAAADTLAHIAFAGVAGGLLIGIAVVPAALASSVVAALCIERMRRSGKLTGDAGLMILLSAGLALASVLLSFAGGMPLQGVLFGSITTVTTADVWLIAFLGCFVCGILWCAWRRLFAAVLDESLARASGLHVERLGDLLMVMAAVTIALSLRTVGVLLVGALMVIPVVAALPWRQGFRATVVRSIIYAELSVLLGFGISVRYGVPSGGSIVLAALAMLVLSFMMVRVRNRTRAGRED